MTEIPKILQIQRFPVNSSQIAEIGHDPGTGTMDILFRRGDTVYRYANVSTAEFDAFKNSPSIGSHFYKYIKPFADKFPFTKIDPQKEQA